MGRYRAIMTDTDREYLGGGEDVDDHKRYQAISRVRSRINEELAKDVEILEENNSELLDELRAVVCEEHQPDGSMALEDDTGARPVHDAGRDGEPDRPDQIEVESLVTADDVPASGKEAEARREAAVAALELLQDYEESDTSSLKEAAWDAYLDAHGVDSLEELVAVPLETYAGASDPPLSLWNNSLLDVVKATEYVEKITDGERRGGYRWVGI